MSIPSVIWRMCQVRRAERLSPDAIKRLRQRRLRRLLEHALAQSRFYVEYYRAHGITADQLDDVELQDLPVINKQIVMENFDALVCDPALTRAGIEQFINECHDLEAKYRGRYHVMHTSGSTGSIGIFVYGERDWHMMQALAATRVVKYRPTLGRIRYAFIVKTDGHHAGIKLCLAAPRIAFQRLPLSVNGALDEVLREVQRFQPHLLGGYGSGLQLLAQEQLAGRIHIRPKRIISSAEPLTDAMKQSITQAFGVVPLDFYTASDSLVIGVSCQYDRGIHLFDDWFCFETADGAGRPVRRGDSVPPGEGSGRLILTNLYNYTQPLIRYEMNDELIPAEGRCPWGSPFPLVRGVAGRVEEILWFNRRDGGRDYVHPIALTGLCAPGAEKWQFVQTAPNALLLRLKIPGGAQTVVQQARDEIVGILRHKHLDECVTVRTEVVDEIPNDPQTGKFRMVIPYHSRANAARINGPARPPN